MLPSDVRGLYKAYNKVYAPKFETILDEMTDVHVNELTDELIEQIVEEVFYECLEEGYNLDNIETVLIESLENSITALNETVLMELNPYAPAGSKESGAYNKATTKSKKSAESAAKRAETIDRVKTSVGNIGSEIRRRGANAAVNAYAAGKMAKRTAKTAGKAALSGAGEVAGKVVKYARKSGQAVSSGYKKGSEGSDDGKEANTNTSAKPQTQSSQSSGSSGGSLRRAAGSLLSRAVKKVVGLGARAVAGTARGVHKLSDKVATRLGEEIITEDPIQDYRDMQRAKQNAAGMRGPELSHSAQSAGSAVQKPQPRSREFSHGTSTGTKPLKSVVKGGLTMSYEPKGKNVDENVGGSVKMKPGSGLGGGTPVYPKGQEPKATGAKLPILQNAHYEYNENDIYDLVMEYLLDTGHVDTNSEALYVMSQLDEEMVSDILDEARRADKLGHERGTVANPNREDVPHSDPSQRTMLHSRLTSRAKQLSRERTNSPEYRQGRRPSLSSKEKSFLQAKDRTSPGRGHVRNPNVPDTGSHAEWPSQRRAQRDPKQNPKHNENN